MCRLGMRVSDESSSSRGREGTRLRPLTVGFREHSRDQPASAPDALSRRARLSRCEKFVNYGDSFDRVPITYVHQAEPDGQANALLQAEPEIATTSC